VSVFARRLERAASIERFPPWYFGIETLDRVVQGVRSGFVNLICARPHVGKTHLALAGIRNNPGVPTMFISADDDPEVAVRKMMLADGTVATMSEAWAASRAELGEFIETNYPALDIVDGVTWGPAAINGQKKLSDEIERFTDDYQQPPGLIVYDYLGIDGGDLSTTLALAGWQKEMTKIMPMPFLIIAQSNRGGARMEKDKDGAMVRRGFRMEDMAYGGEQQAGLIMGLSRSNRMLGDGVMRSALEVDVVKNKAVFDGSGLTTPAEPVTLVHYEGRLVDAQTIRLAAMAHDQWMREEAMRGAWQ